MQVKDKLKKDKKSSKYSFVNIDNVVKRIYTKPKKNGRKPKNSKKNTKSSVRHSESVTIHYERPKEQNYYERVKRYAKLNSFI